MKKIFLLFVSLCFATLIQALTISNNTAGNLATAVGPELTTCSSLIITGNIDARDFVIMRDKMSALTTIDLSGTTVVEYTSTYPANTIPAYAFSLNTIAVKLMY